MGPLRAGLVYGIVAAVVAVAVELRFLYLSPEEMTNWVVAAIESFFPLLAVVTYFFMGILAAIRVRPSRLDQGVPYRSIMLRDCTLAATIVAVVVGVTLLIVVALQATVFADAMRGYASEAAPQVVSYVEELSEELSDPPEPTTAEGVEAGLQPPTLRNLGVSLFNLVLRALALGFIGAGIGVLRGFLASRRSESEEVATPGK